MKLLFCKKCGDVFKLAFTTKACECGKSKAVYVDKELEHGVYTGEHAIPVGFANGDFAKAVLNQPHSVEGGKRFQAFVVPKTTPTFYRDGDGPFDMEGRENTNIGMRPPQHPPRP